MTLRHYRFQRLNEGRQPPAYLVHTPADEIGVVTRRGPRQYEARPRESRVELAPPLLACYPTRVDAANAIVDHLERTPRR